MPQAFVRCDYPTSHQQIMEQLVSDKKIVTSICELFAQANGNDSRPVPLPYLKMVRIDEFRHEYGQHFHRVLSALAYHRLGTIGFGGKKKQIFTKDIVVDPEDRFIVIGKRTVVTGEYYAPYHAGEDSECGGLTNQKHHVLLHLGACTDNVVSKHDDGTPIKQTELWIEEVNVSACQ